MRIRNAYRLAVLGIFIGAPAFAFSQARATPVSLASEAQAYVRTLSKPAYFFHYTAQENISGDVSSASAPGVQKYLADSVASYWNASGAPDAYGHVPGLYVADDPYSSQDYGGPSWYLIQFELPKGLRYLDLRLGDGAAANILSSEDQAKLKAASCPSATRFEDLFLNAVAAPCRQVAYQTLRDLGVGAIFYPWIVASFHHCSHSLDASAIIVQPSLIQASMLTFFSPEVQAQDELASERGMLEAVRLDIVDNIIPTHLQPSDAAPLWESLPPVPEAELSDWEKAHLFECESP